MTVNISSFQINFKFKEKKISEQLKSILILIKDHLSKVSFS